MEDPRGVALRAVNGLALCAGIEGIGLGLSLAVPGYRTVCAVEWDAYCAAVLVAHQQAGALPPFPVWDSVESFDGRPWRGRVDIVTAGWPCQPWSVAGQRRGVRDERWIWPDIARVIREVGPRFVFLENVPGLLTGGLGHVLGDLAALGFAAEWLCLRASDVGAPHRRDRLFLLADAAHDGRAGDGSARNGRAGSENGSGELADAHQQRQRQPDDQASAVSRHDTWPDIGGRGGGLGTFPPGPDDRASWERVLAVRPDLAPATQSPVRGLADGAAGGLGRPRYRSAQLRALGNAVVPLQAAVAFRELWRRLNT